MASKRTVELFYDVVSPYSLFAFETLVRYKPFWNMELRLRPFFLGGIMAGSENTHPALTPVKAIYYSQDISRASQYFGVPCQYPRNFYEMAVTKGTLRCQRFLTAVDGLHPQFTEPLSRQLWTRIFELDVDVTEPSSLIEAAVKAGMDEVFIEDALNYMHKKEYKDKLRATTREALDLGCFGAPFIVADMEGKKETFFGSDRFPILAMVLGEEWRGPQPEESESSESDSD